MDLGPGERDPGHLAGRPGPFDAQMSIRDGTHPSIVASRTTGYALAMLIGIDHLVIAVPDPDSAAADLAAALGLTPGGGGRHDRLGTYNRLIWLGDTYLELIGVFDAELAGESWVGAADAARPRIRAGTGLATWAVATDDIEGDLARLRATGSDLGPVQPGERTRPDGRVVTWRLAAAPTLEPAGPPFLIEHDPTSAEWTAADRAARAAEPARLTALEIGVTDVAATTFRFLKTVGLRFRPSLQGGGARDADIGRQIVRIRPRRPDPEPPTTHPADHPGSGRSCRSTSWGVAGSSAPSEQVAASTQVRGPDDDPLADPREAGPLEVRRRVRAGECPGRDEVAAMLGGESRSGVDERALDPATACRRHHRCPALPTDPVRLEQRPGGDDLARQRRRRGGSSRACAP